MIWHEPSYFEPQEDRGVGSFQKELVITGHTFLSAAVKITLHVKTVELWSGAEAGDFVL